MFVIDERDAQSKVSINRKGHLQADLMGLAVEVKDSTRNPGKWAYYGFEPNAKTAEAMPKDSCWSCHEQHAAVAPHVRAVLSHAEACGEEFRHIQRSPRKGRRGEVNREATRPRN
jgi:hypothetical protein